MDLMSLYEGSLLPSIFRPFHGASQHSDLWNSPHMQVVFVVFSRVCSGISESDKRRESAVVPWTSAVEETGEEWGVQHAVSSTSKR